MNEIEVPISAVNRNCYDTRKDYGDLSGIKSSISKFGVVQSLVARKNDDGNYELAFGGRRLKAMQELGMSNINLSIRSLSDSDMALLVLCENVHRKDLNPVEQARAYQRGLGASKMELGEFAKVIGVGHKTVKDYLFILSLPERILEKAQDYTLAQLTALGNLGELSTSVRTELENELKNQNMSPMLIRQIVNSCENIFGSPLPDKKKRDLSTQVIRQDYSHLVSSQYHEVRAFTDALIESEVAKHNKHIMRTSASLQKARGVIQRKVKNVSDVINYDAKINEIGQELREANMHIRTATRENYYHQASKRAQSHFRKTVRSVVLNLETLLKNAE